MMDHLGHSNISTTMNINGAAFPGKVGSLADHHDWGRRLHHSDGTLGGQATADLATIYGVDSSLGGVYT